MFDRLLGFVAKATSVVPDYRPEHCLAVTRQTGGCSLCAEACPHQAITINRQVEIDDIDCTGCGLCIQACPSQALEAKPAYRPGAALKCSRVKGSAQSVQCLARLQPSDLLRLAGTRKAATLARGDCASCPIGGAAVPAAVDELRNEAASLAAFLERDFELRVLVVERLDEGDSPDAISRRELFKGGLRSLQHTAADALAPLDPGGREDDSLPRELERRYRLVERSAPQPEAPVPWVLPRVAEGCIMCPVCTNVCPTDAFSREFDPPGEGDGAVLRLDPERCNGCGACVKSCPVKVISLSGDIQWAELSGGPVEAYRRVSGQGAPLSISRGPGGPIAGAAEPAGAGEDEPAAGPEME